MSQGKSRSFKLFFSLVIGAFLGIVMHPFSHTPEVVWINENLIHPVGQIFLRLLFVTVVPLVFSALVLGVVELGQGVHLGRVALKTLWYTILLSSVSVLIGIALVNIFQPGAGFQIDQTLLDASKSVVTQAQQNAEQAKTFAQTIVEFIPKNPLEAATKAMSGEMLSLMVYTVIFGFALSIVMKKNNEEDNSLVRFLRCLFDVSMKFIDFAYAIAPFGVFAIMFNTVFKFGADVLGALLYFAFVVVFGLFLQLSVVYGSFLKFFTSMAPSKFFKAIKEVMMYSFSTASSNAALPLSMETAEKKLMLPPRISRFVLTVGATANQNGTALFEGVTVLFLAQVYKIDLSIGKQVQVVLMSILAGIGTAGVPGGSLPVIVLLLQSVGIPAEGIGLILGVDRFLDMCRTTLNVTGDLVITSLVSEGEPVT